MDLTERRERTGRVGRRRKRKRSAAGKIFFALVIAAALGALCGAAFARVTGGSKAVLQTTPFARIKMLDKSGGWALDFENNVLRTTNGGKKWKSVYRCKGNALSIDVSFVGEKAAFVSANAADEGALVYVYSTQNAGRSWKSTEVATFNQWEKTDVAKTKISFPDEKTGYLMTVSSDRSGITEKALYKSIDGGKNFSFIGNLGGIEGDPTGMVFITGEIGFITCENRGQNYLLLYRTTDGGKTWANQSIELPEEYRGHTYLTEYHINPYPPAFVAKQKIEAYAVFEFVTGADTRRYLYHSSDGGNTWSAKTGLSGAAFRDYSFIDSLTGYALDESGNMYITHDGGASWTR